MMSLGLRSANWHARAMWECCRVWSSFPVMASHSFAEKSADAVAASMAVLLSTQDHTAP